MELRAIGKSSLKVSAIGLGCWQFSHGIGMPGKYWPQMDQKVVRDVIQTSIEHGVNWFDTAEVYGWGESERELTNSLSDLGNKPGEFIIATKWWPLFRFASSIFKTINQRLEALHGYPIDLYQVHQPFSLSSVTAQMEAMAKLVLLKKIRSVGVSNFSAKRMEKAFAVLQKYGARLESNQVRYSLLDRRIESNGVLDLAGKLNITIIAYSPLAQGILSGRFHEHPEQIARISGYRKYMPQFKKGFLEKCRPVISVLKELSEKYDATPAQISLAWVIQHHGDKVVAIPGASSVKQAAANAQAMELQLSEEDLIRLDQISVPFK